MATTYQSARTAAGVQARAGLGIQSASATFAFLAATHNTIANIFEMVKIPAGATVLDVILSSTAIGASAVQFSVGDGSGVARYITDTSAGTGAGVYRLNAQAGLNYKYTAADTIDIKLVAAAVTPADGTLELTVIYTMDA